MKMRIFSRDCWGLFQCRQQHRHSLALIFLRVGRGFQMTAEPHSLPDTLKLDLREQFKPVPFRLP